MMLGNARKAGGWRSCGQVICDEMPLAEDRDVEAPREWKAWRERGGVWSGPGSAADRVMLIQAVGRYCQGYGTIVCSESRVYVVAQLQRARSAPGCKQPDFPPNDGQVARRPAPSVSSFPVIRVYNSASRVPTSSPQINARSLQTKVLIHQAGCVSIAQGTPTLETGQESKQNLSCRSSYSETIHRVKVGQVIGVG
ncbi:hypothetical protein BDY17DRAFT_15265 [Neohortaea acidophila]|uniref:Uncharacterized protein n=1 Tax=Neohortaea acidophila TaxID=245834 RepID=A0A6A6Q6H4_9PEZI|nr:uncharacterized protein BDY17DRAFT_15265 [Neohortaea acidophila]KAF2487639.1 hypothetical protein BDY17DRAFT_15265 [Neohortaea acidophila]